jgi:hypothetical protein
VPSACRRRLSRFVEDLSELKEARIHIEAPGTQTLVIQPDNHAFPAADQFYSGIACSFALSYHQAIGGKRFQRYAASITEVDVTAIAAHTLAGIERGRPARGPCAGVQSAECLEHRR